MCGRVVGALQMPEAARKLSSKRVAPRESHNTDTMRCQAETPKKVLATVLFTPSVLVSRLTGGTKNVHPCRDAAHSSIGIRKVDHQIHAEYQAFIRRPKIKHSFVEICIH